MRKNAGPKGRYPYNLYFISSILLAFLTAEIIGNLFGNLHSSNPIINSIMHTAVALPFFYILFCRRMGRLVKNLKAAEGQLHLQISALESAANGILITDRKGDIVWANRAFTELTGYPTEEIIGQNTRIFKSGQHDQALYNDLWETIKEGKVWHGEMINRRKDGSLYFEEMTITPVLDEKGDIIYYVAIKQDVSIRKKMEEELSKSNRLLTALISSSPMAIICLDCDGVVITWNKAAEEIFGWKEEEVIGTKLPVIHEEMIEEFSTLFRMVVAGKVLNNIDVSSRRKDTVRRDINLTAAPLHSDTGEIIGVIGMMRDVTIKKEMAAALKKAEEERLKNRNLEALGRLAVGIAHEINNPLTNACLNVEILKNNLDGQKLDADTLRKLEAIENNLDRVSVIARELLNFSSYQMSCDFSRQNLNNLISESLSFIEHKLGNVVIHNNASDTPDIMCDPVKMEQVIINILNNSVEAMPEGGNVVISTSDEDEFIRMEISDTGTGIPESEISKVFEPFFTTKEFGTGTGLGLSICHGIVTQHNGTINISSDAGNGTSVVIRLPKAKGAEAV